MIFTFHYGQIYYLVYQIKEQKHNFIYIPLWLDLLSKSQNFALNLLNEFTFHYCQIYYNIFHYIQAFGNLIYIPLWLDLLLVAHSVRQGQQQDLHSTMVRFIIILGDLQEPGSWKFTFHYGQIYYSEFSLSAPLSKLIYIPLWLDLLSIVIFFVDCSPTDLHSTMVRFIIFSDAQLISLS